MERHHLLTLCLIGVLAVADSSGEIRFAHYNILASYLGKNSEPWFLLPLNISSEFRDSLLTRYYRKDEHGVCSSGFHDAFGGLLNSMDMAQVEEYNRQFFDWNVRGPLVIGVVQSLDADIISLVEMDRFDEFAQALAGEYDGAFAKRPRPESLDGSSLFWRHDRFELVGEPMNFTFQDWEPTECDEYHEDRVMVAAALRDRHSGDIIVVASVHLARNPEDKGKDPMRMLEVSQMMRGLSCFVTQVHATGLVIMGDFNAVPQSFTHAFLLHGWQDCPEADKNMRGVFDKVVWQSGEGLCTTKTLARALWIDYIFYSNATMDVAEAPQVDTCPDGPIPDGRHPSDHIPLQATLRVRPGAGALSHRAALTEEVGTAQCFVPEQSA
mmetsp:Transcript_13001/g.29507  ORF Transcript_13001/g.29507 Transcript_13001/m.29507 type:complete len:382 (+) Transcript_13001:73-1218(+)